jgi:hypothetical protein
VRELGGAAQHERDHASQTPRLSHGEIHRRADSRRQGRCAGEPIGCRERLRSPEVVERLLLTVARNGVAARREPIACYKPVTYPRGPRMSPPHGRVSHDRIDQGPLA